VTYLNPKAEPIVRPLAVHFGSSVIAPCDVREPGQPEAVFTRIRNESGHLNFLHSIAYAPKEDLHSRITDCFQAWFTMAMDVSC
jgi:enoyl-[acyl-carrier protein] reductase I